MPTLDELDAICAYLEDQGLYHNSLYRAPSSKFVPRAPRRAPAIWIVRDGKPVEFSTATKTKEKKGEEDGEGRCV